MSFLKKKRLWNNALVPATATTYYTAPVGTETQIIAISAMNTDASASYTIELYHNESGGASAAKDQVIEVTLGPNETRTFFHGAVLNTGDFISALSSSASKIALHGYGVELTQGG
jgi:hypothetical protein